MICHSVVVPDFVTIVVCPATELNAIAGEITVVLMPLVVLTFGAMKSICVEASNLMFFDFRTIVEVVYNIAFPEASNVRSHLFFSPSVCTFTIPDSYISMSEFFAWILCTYASLGWLPAIARALSQFPGETAPSPPKVDAK